MDSLALQAALRSSRAIAEQMLQPVTVLVASGELAPVYCCAGRSPGGYRGPTGVVCPHPRPPGRTLADAACVLLTGIQLHLLSSPSCVISRGVSVSAFVCAEAALGLFLQTVCM